MHFRSSSRRWSRSPSPCSYPCRTSGLGDNRRPCRSHPLPCHKGCSGCSRRFLPCTAGSPGASHSSHRCHRIPCPCSYPCHRLALPHSHGPCHSLPHLQGTDLSCCSNHLPRHNPPCNSHQNCQIPGPGSCQIHRPASPHTGCGSHSHPHPVHTCSGLYSSCFPPNICPQASRNSRQ